MWSAGARACVISSMRRATDRSVERLDSIVMVAPQHAHGDDDRHGGRTRRRGDEGVCAPTADEPCAKRRKKEHVPHEVREWFGFLCTSRRTVT